MRWMWTGLLVACASPVSGLLDSELSETENLGLFLCDCPSFVQNSGLGDVEGCTEFFAEQTSEEARSCLSEAYGLDDSSEAHLECRLDLLREQNACLLAAGCEEREPCMRAFQEAIAECPALSDGVEDAVSTCLNG